MLPVEHNDPINSRILAISEDKIEGFVREPFDEIARRSGVGADMVVARIAANCFSSLDAPVLRVGAKDCFVPSAVSLEDEMLPSTDELRAKVAELLAY